MNEKCLLTDILTTLKGVTDLYLHGTIESATDNVRQAFKTALVETLDLQNKTYKFMENLGYYQMQNVDMTKVTQTKNKICNDCTTCC